MKKSLAICIFVLLVIMVSLLLASKHCDHVFENWEVEINATCTEDGIKHSKCTNCDKTISEVIPATGHLESKMEVIKPATCEVDGLAQSHCENCGEILSTKSTPALGHVKSDVKIVSTVDNPVLACIPVGIPLPLSFTVIELSLLIITSILLQYPANASSIALSTISQTK